MARVLLRQWATTHGASIRQSAGGGAATANSWEGTVNTRKVVAALVLAMLPAMMVGMQGAIAPTPDMNWGYFWGMGGADAAAFGIAGVLTCGFFATPIGGIACGLVGVG